jgi:hypothetical protein
VDQAGSADSTQIDSSIDTATVLEGNSDWKRLSAAARLDETTIGKRKTRSYPELRGSHSGAVKVESKNVV